MGIQGLNGKGEILEGLIVERGEVVRAQYKKTSTGSYKPSTLPQQGLRSATAHFSQVLLLSVSNSKNIWTRCWACMPEMLQVFKASCKTALSFS